MKCYDFINKITSSIYPGEILFRSELKYFFPFIFDWDLNGKSRWGTNLFNFNWNDWMRLRCPFAKDGILHFSKEKIIHILTSHYWFIIYSIILLAEYVNNNTYLINHHWLLTSMIRYSKTYRNILLFLSKEEFKPLTYNFKLTVWNPNRLNIKRILYLKLYLDFS